MELKCEYCKKDFKSNRRRKYCFEPHYKDCGVCGKSTFIKDMKFIPQTCGDGKCQTKLRKTYIRTCQICGDEFESKTSRGKFCNKKHYRACISCGGKFEVSPYRLKTKTCSKKCAAAIVDFDIRNAKTATTLGEKYGPGITNASQAEEVKQKKKETTLKNHGVENPLQSPEIRARAKATMIRKFGVDNPGKSPEIMAKARETNIKRYGVVNTFQSEEFKAKSLETLREKYGNQSIINPSQIPEIKEKIKATNLKRYGHTSYLGSKEFQSNPKNHNSKRISKTNLRWQDKLKKELGVDFKLEVPFGENRYADLGYGDILIDINPTVTHNVSISYPCLINGCEPKCRKNGHEPPHKNIHQERFLGAEANNKTLLQYFDWMDEDIFLSVVRAKLHLDENKAPARKCLVKKISQADANKFFNANHLLGAANGQTFCVGLLYGGELVHVNSFGKSRFNKNFEWEAIRSCSKQNWHVQGGLRRADAYFKKVMKPSSIVSYVDLALGGGAAETANPGWELLHTNKPSSNWINVVGGEDQPTVVKSSTARRVSADRLLGFEVGERYPSHHPDGTVFSNALVLFSEGYLEVYGVGSRTFGWEK